MGKALLENHAAYIFPYNQRVTPPLGYKVVTGKNGREAVVLAGREHPDLILLDYHMPFMNDYNAAGIISGSESTSQTPIITITTYGTKELRARR